MGLKNYFFLITFLFTILSLQAQVFVTDAEKASLIVKANELKNSSELAEFIKKAKKVNVSDKGIDSIIFAKLLQDFKIKKLKKSSKETNTSFLIDFSDKKFDKQSFIADYRNVVNKVLTKDQFQYIYSDLLDKQINREVKKTLTHLEHLYIITAAADKKVMEKWVNTYTTNAVVMLQYHAYDRKYARSAYEEILNEGKLKYTQVARQLKLAPTNPLKKDKETLFIEKAATAGVSESTALAIIDASALRDKKIKDIETLSKSESSFVYRLDTDKYSKRAANDSFKKDLASLITIKQFKALFGDQLSDDIYKKTSKRMAQINGVYNLNTTQYKKINVLVTDYFTNELLTTHYLAFNKKLMNQKLKVIKFKFDAAYKKEIKLIDK